MSDVADWEVIEASIKSVRDRVNKLGDKGAGELVLQIACLLKDMPAGQFADLCETVRAGKVTKAAIAQQNATTDDSAVLAAFKARRIARTAAFRAQAQGSYGLR